MQEDGGGKRTVFLFIPSICQNNRFFWLFTWRLVCSTDKTSSLSLLLLLYRGGTAVVVAVVVVVVVVDEVQVGA